MIFKQDSPLLGFLIGFSIPIICYVLQLKFIPILIGHSFTDESMQLFSLVCNVPFLRYFLINLKFEKAGKGILFATFIYAIIWIYINQVSI